MNDNENTNWTLQVMKFVNMKRTKLITSYEQVFRTFNIIIIT